MSRPGSIAIAALLLASFAGPGWTGDATALIAEGEANLKAGEIDAGLSQFRRAAEQDPSSSLAQTRIGGALLLKQDYRTAIEAFRSAIMLDGANADAFIGMAMAYLHSGDYALARASLEEAKRIDPAKGLKVDEVIAYIDQREAGDGGH
jgi:tetratricopeptide (TPR) repeat protein